MKKAKKLSLFIIAAQIVFLICGCSKTANGFSEADSVTEETDSRFTADDSGEHAAAPYIEKYEFNEPLPKWSDRNVEIAKATYDEFSVCSAYVDGEWKKCLYNEKNNLSVIQESETEYSVYNGNSVLMLSTDMTFPSEARATIMLGNADNSELLMINLSDNDVFPVQYVIDIEKMKIVNPICNKDEAFSFICNAKDKDYSEEYYMADFYFRIGEDAITTGALDTIQYTFYLVSLENHKEFIKAAASFMYNAETCSYELSAPVECEGGTTEFPYW